MCFSSKQSEQPPPPPEGQPTSPSLNATAASILIPPSQWSTGLCGCCSDVSTCCLTYWCPCVTFGRSAEIVDMGATTCELQGILYFIMSASQFAWVYGWIYRFKMRQRYMLPEEPCNDCLVHCCCHACALCQEYRELKHRGFNMSLGWRGNMERRNHGITMPPNPLHEMER
ncbi:protein PLANT CADMIUM RESISTANCE 2-like [Bidens hawaiensis]|uniref:protein PLANT CADMIUM RESISTANCE 2-like n=1 Tax=Bidens hawaiensis TaxID=980011 RepID=UPI0040493296